MSKSTRKVNFKIMSPHDDDKMPSLTYNRTI